MSATQILEIAKTSPKRNWRTYSSLKGMLSDWLSEAEYNQFIRELCKILRV